MTSAIPARRARLIERIVAAARARARPGRPAPVAAPFLRAYYRGVAEEDLATRDPRYLAAAALDHLALGSRRPSGRTLVQVVSPTLERDGFASAHTLVQVVAPDMPFLVNSVGIVFSRAGIGVHLIVHPVLRVSRDGRGALTAVDLPGGPAAAGRLESWQLLEIDRQLDSRRLERLARALRATLADVRAAVADWAPMSSRAHELAEELAHGAAPRGAAREAAALLEWMADDHFTFLGYRRYRLRRGRGRDLLVPQGPSGLGILRVPRRGVSPPAPVPLRGEIRRRARAPDPLIVTKANSVATVHRATYLDYVGIKSFDRAGRVTGEHRFLGLWTSSVYEASSREIPVLRRKVAEVVRRFGLVADSHDAKAVQHALETFPRDELFQATVPELVRIVRGIVNLYERALVRVLARRDAFERFHSCFVYVPRDRYSTAVRNRIEAILSSALGGRDVETQVQLSESTLARLHVVVRTGTPERRAGRAQHDLDAASLERAIAAAIASWSDRLQAELACPPCIPTTWSPVRRSTTCASSMRSSSRPASRACVSSRRRPSTPAGRA
jgi:glutamate dehydrogenase